MQKATESTTECGAAMNMHVSIDLTASNMLIGSTTSKHDQSNV